MRRVILNPCARIEKRLFRFSHRDAVPGRLVAVALVLLKTLDVCQRIHGLQCIAVVCTSQHLKELRTAVHNRTGFFFFAKNCFTSPTVQVPKWKMLAARTASVCLFISPKVSRWARKAGRVQI